MSKKVDKKALPSLVYLIYGRHFLEENDDVMACTLDKAKAEKIVKTHEKKREIIGEQEDGEPVYDYDYWVCEKNLV